MRQTARKEAVQPAIHSQGEIGRRLLTERRDVIEAIALNPLGPGFGGEGQGSDDALIDQLRDVEYSHREALSRRLHQLDEALERIRTGSYGLCTECGALIVETRLTIDPAAALCVGCQTSFESANS